MDSRKMLKRIAPTLGDTHVATRAPDGGRGCRGYADNEADAQVDHAVAQIGDSAGNAGGDHDEERGAARDEVSRADGELHARNDDGSAAHAH